MKAIVVFDSQGEIQTLTLIEPHAGFSMGMVAPPGHEVLELELPDELRDRSAVEIHREYQIDRKQRALVRRRTAG